jgi:hypothetical protein
MFPMKASRYRFDGTYNDEAVVVIYGCDHAIGYYVEVWRDEADDTPLLDECTLFDELHHGRLVERLTALGCPNEEHIMLAAADQPF